MPHQHGKSARIYAAGYDLSGDASDVNINPIVQLADATTFLTGGVQTTTKQFLVGMADGKADQKTFFDDTIGHVYPMVTAVRNGGNVTLSFYPAGDGTQGNLGYGGIGELLTDPKFNSPIAGVTTLSLAWQNNTGAFEDLVSLLPKAQQTGTGAQQVGTALDNGAGTTAGASVYFNITAIDAATTVSGFKLQHSTDNSTWADLLTSGLAGTAIGGDRQATAAGATINRYLRAVWTLTSGNHATLQVGVSRH